MLPKTVLITGSSRGIGKEIAKTFAEKNYNVVINCKKSRIELDETYKELKKINPNILKVKCDIGNISNVEKMFLEIEKEFGSIDILVNNASVSKWGLFNESKKEDWDDLINNNIYSVLNCSKVALDYMIERKSGSIINISSIWGIKGASCEVIYSMTKGAVNSFTKALAKEIGPCNITVNAIACGLIDTKMNNNLTTDDRKFFLEDVPLMRIGNVKDVAELCYYLASEKNSYLTGQIITIDGGLI